MIIIFYVPCYDADPHRQKIFWPLFLFSETVDYILKYTDVIYIQPNKRILIKIMS